MNSQGTDFLAEGKLGTPELVDLACQSAEEAFWHFGYSSRANRARFLDVIADEIEARANAIVEIGAEETGLPVGRFQSEMSRTTNQLRLFAKHILTGDYLDRHKDSALPNRKPLPRPELRLVQRPIGPVAVFGASNFPLAFSTAGGDTAAALAAGCPVVVKGHSAHPRTGRLVAQAIEAAKASTEQQPGVFTLIQGGKRDVGTSLVQHPLIKAVGFTGSLGGGRALFDLCAARPEPIPFFGELGSVNPMFVLSHAAAARGREIGEGWAASLTMGVGQFCTNPGLVLVEEGEAGDAFVSAARSALSEIGPQSMLTDGIAASYRDGRDRIGAANGVGELVVGYCSQRKGAPSLFETTAENWFENDVLGEEVFGPLGLIVRTKDLSQMKVIARRLEGQLTATIHLDPSDERAARDLMPILERKAGRLLANGFPTGVEVADAMVHGGPYPASTNFGATSVGTLSIRRFLRPVCYQNVPAGLLPVDLQ